MKLFWQMMLFAAAMSRYYHKWNYRWLLWGLAAILTVIAAVYFASRFLIRSVIPASGKIR